MAAEGLAVEGGGLAVKVGWLAVKVGGLAIKGLVEAAVVNSAPSEPEPEPMIRFRLLATFT